MYTISTLNKVSLSLFIKPLKDVFTILEILWTLFYDMFQHFFMETLAFPLSFSTNVTAFTDASPTPFLGAS